MLRYEIKTGLFGKLSKITIIPLSFTILLSWFPAYTLVCFHGGTRDIMPMIGGMKTG